MIMKFYLFIYLRAVCDSSAWEALVMLKLSCHHPYITVKNHTKHRSPTLLVQTDLRCLPIAAEHCKVN